MYAAEVRRSFIARGCSAWGRYRLSYALETDANRMKDQIVITGANGHIGQRLITKMASDYSVRALVRSGEAARMLEKTPADEVRIVDYTSALAMARALEGCVGVVHLVGIIRESRGSTYVDAHENATRALYLASEKVSVRKIVYLSVLGASVNSTNVCLASKARAERVLTEGTISSSILRVPMVLGANDYASRALLKRASSRLAFAFRAASLEQPIDVDDVIAAVMACMESSVEGVVCLAGPVSLSRRVLFERAGFQGTLISLPMWLGVLVARCLEWASDNPPMTRAMLGILDHDDNIDTGAIVQKLGITLTSLDETLQKINPAID